MRIILFILIFTSFASAEISLLSEEEVTFRWDKGVCSYDCRLKFQELSKDEQISQLDRLYIERDTKNLSVLQGVFLSIAIQNNNLSDFHSRLLLLEMNYQYEKSSYIDKQEKDLVEKSRFELLNDNEKIILVKDAIEKNQYYPLSMSYEEIFFSIYNNEVNTSDNLILSRSLIDILSQSSYGLTALLQELFNDDKLEDIKTLLSHLEADQRNKILCDNLDEEIVTFEESYFEDCESYPSCEMVITDQGDEFLSIYSELDVKKCLGKSLRSYIAEFVAYNVENLDRDTGYEQLNKVDKANVQGADCYETYSFDYQVKFVDQIVDVLVQTRNCSFDEVARGYPEFVRDNTKKGKEAITNHDEVYLANEGKKSNCHYHLELAKSKSGKDSGNQKTLDELYEILNLVYRGNAF